MIALSSLEELHAARQRIEDLKDGYPELFEKLVHIVSLTKQMQLHCDYLGCLLLDQDPERYRRPHIRSSVLRLYREEIESLKRHPEAEEVKKLFQTCRPIKYRPLCQLILGESPESLKGII
ncbi:hypothetical protein [Salibacterium aidingense]|uniref:hypothetical protein n=1 Tax=Salibacterium aidingense TaxID=384933 RepID=UPI003BC546F8